MGVGLIQHHRVGGQIKAALIGEDELVKELALAGKNAGDEGGFPPRALLRAVRLPSSCLSSA